MITAVRKGLPIFIGLILGAIVSWALAIAYSTLNIEHGLLAVPLAVVIAVGVWLWRRQPLRPLVAGFVAGAAIETAFFLWLFAELPRGF